MATVVEFHPKIPLARDLATGRMIRPEEATYPAPEASYRCLDPKCTGFLNVVRRGKTVYFRHNPGQASDNCGFSRRFNKTGRRHDAALHLLAAVFGEAIHLRAPMPVLSILHAGMTTFTTLCLNATKVQTEWVCMTSGRRADIALLDRYDHPVLLVEIFHTHAVDRNKRQDLSAYRWIEVTANDVINDYEKLVIRQQGNVLGYIFDPDHVQLQLPGMQRTQWSLT